LSCVGRGLGAGLIPHPRSLTKCIKGSISKREKSDASKRHKENEEEEEEEEGMVKIPWPFSINQWADNT
jgi:hypothetical protein